LTPIIRRNNGQNPPPRVLTRADQMLVIVNTDRYNRYFLFARSISVAYC